MEVKIGVHNAPRELVVESTQSPDEVQQAVMEAVHGQQGLRALSLTDERGRQVIVMTEHLAYVEIGGPVERPVGFGTT